MPAADGLDHVLRVHDTDATMSEEAVAALVEDCLGLRTRAGDERGVGARDTP